MVKIKVITGMTWDSMETQCNEFLVGKKLIDIKFQSSVFYTDSSLTESDETGTLIVIYE